MTLVLAQRLLVGVQQRIEVERIVVRFRGDHLSTTAAHHWMMLHVVRMLVQRWWLLVMLHVNVLLLQRMLRLMLLKGSGVRC